jgi:hypothetical protein
MFGVVCSNLENCENSIVFLSSIACDCYEKTPRKKIPVRYEPQDHGNRKIPFSFFNLLSLSVILHIKMRWKPHCVRLISGVLVSSFDQRPLDTVALASVIERYLFQSSILAAPARHFSSYTARYQASDKEYEYRTTKNSSCDTSPCIIHSTVRYGTAARVLTVDYEYLQEDRSMY